MFIKAVRFDKLHFASWPSPSVWKTSQKTLAREASVMNYWNITPR